MSLEGNTSATGGRAEGRNEVLRQFTERVEKNIAVLEKEIRQLEEAEDSASLEHRDSGTKARLSYARAELVAAQEARESRFLSADRAIMFSTTFPMAGR